jgi:hypothetical protein
MLYSNLRGPALPHPNRLARPLMNALTIPGIRAPLLPSPGPGRAAGPAEP